MTTVYKSLFIISLLFIVVCGAVQIALKTLPLEFAKARYGESFDSLFFIGMPLAIAMTAIRLRYRKNLNGEQKSLVRFYTFGLAITFLVLAFISGINNLGAGMCGYSNGKTLFINKQNPSEKIIMRYFGCGATDSGPATARVLKVRYTALFFAYYKQADTTNLDRASWIRVIQ